MTSSPILNNIENIPYSEINYIIIGSTLFRTFYLMQRVFNDIEEVMLLSLAGMVKLTEWLRRMRTHQLMLQL